MEKVYVQAVMELLESGSKIETVLGNLRTVMMSRGHAKALPVVLRAVVRTLEQGSTESVATVTVAREADVVALKADIKSALATLGADTAYNTVVDDTIIGGLIATYNHRQVDQSYRSKLVTLYQSITN
jgi:F0F1-type ATP synthase delta subunit